MTYSTHFAWALPWAIPAGIKALAWIGAGAIGIGLSLPLPETDLKMVSSPSFHAISKTKQLADIKAKQPNKKIKYIR